MNKIIYKIESKIKNSVLRNLVVTLIILLVNPLSVAVYGMFVCALFYKYFL